MIAWMNCETQYINNIYSQKIKKNKYFTKYSLKSVLRLQNVTCKFAYFNGEKDSIKGKIKYYTILVQSA